MPQEQRPTEKFRTSVGGQALMEGIMMRGPEKICCAVRRPDGTIDLSYSDVTTHWYNKVPLVRGVCNMVENLMNGYKYLMHSADIAMTEEEKEEEKQNESKLDGWLDDVAAGVTGLVHIFNPELVLIGGGVSAQQKLLIDPLAAQVRKSVMPAFAEGLELKSAALQNDAGLVGAVYYFKEQQ